MLVSYGRCLGLKKYTRRMFRTIFSSGSPFFSYIATRKKGSMTMTMQMAAALIPVWPLSKKKSGTPMSAPHPKQTSCLFVRLNMTFVFTAVRSLGTGTYATQRTSCSFAAAFGDAAARLVAARSFSSTEGFSFASS